MNTSRLLKSVLILSLFTAFLLTFSHAGAYAFEGMLQSDQNFPEGTLIGPVDVSGKTRQAAEELLTEKMNEWQQGKIPVRYVEKQVKWESSIVQFHIKESVAEAVPNKANPIYTDVAEDDIKQKIEADFPALNSSQFDFVTIRKTLAREGAALQPNKAQLQIDRYIAGAKMQQQTVAEVYRDQADVTAGIKMILEKLPVIQVKASSQISLLQELKEKQLSDISAKDLSTVSSLLFELILQTNFAVLEKNQSEKLPSGTPAGLEAKVNPSSNQDFIFANPNKAPYTISFQNVKNGLYACVKGIPFAYNYSKTLKDKQTFPPKKVIQYTDNVPNGQQLSAGKDGELIKTYREVHNSSGKLIKSEKISEDFYPAVPEIVAHSLIDQSAAAGDSTSPDPNAEDSLTSGNAENNSTTAQSGSGSVSNNNDASGQTTESDGSTTSSDSSEGSKGTSSSAQNAGSSENTKGSSNQTQQGEKQNSSNSKSGDQS